MAKATAEVTVYQSKSVKATYRYYLLSTSKPSKPTTFPPATTWVSTEPSYTEGSTNNLYFVDCTVFTNGSFLYSEVSISSAYEAAKLAYNKALDAESTASTTADSLAAWCHANNKTLIDGSKIYTGSITADKLKVSSLQAISANIGGFSIGNNALFAGTLSITDQNNGVYLGTDGIRTVDADGSTLMKGYMTRFDSPEGNTHVSVSSAGIGLYSQTIDGSWEFQAIEFIDEGVGQMYLMHDGIHHASSTSEYPALGFGTDPNITELGQTTRLHGDLYMEGKGNIGTSKYPTGSHVLANDKQIYGLNSASVSTRLIGLSSSDNIIIGTTAGDNGSIFSYIASGKNYSISEGSDFVFGTTMDGTERVFRSVPTYNRTTTGGTGVRVAANGELSRYTSSSMRYKEEITQKLDDSLNPERLYDLGIYQYKYRDGYISEHDQRYGKLHIGLLAEDVKHTYPIAANYNEDGQVEDWSERYLIPAMLKLIQNQNKEIQNIKAILKGEVHENH